MRGACAWPRLPARARACLHACDSCSCKTSAWSTAVVLMWLGFLLIQMGRFGFFRCVAHARTCRHSAGTSTKSCTPVHATARAGRRWHLYGEQRGAADAGRQHQPVRRFGCPGRRIRCESHSTRTHTQTHAGAHTRTRTPTRMRVFVSPSPASQAGAGIVMVGSSAALTRVSITENNAMVSL